MPYPDRMQCRGAWKRRGFAVAAIALTLAVVAPELASTAGGRRAGSRPRDRGETGRPYGARAQASGHRGDASQGLHARGRAREDPGVAGCWPAERDEHGSEGNAGRREAPARPRRAAPGVAEPGRAEGRGAKGSREAAGAAAAARQSNQKKKKSSSLSLPFLAFLAILPFVLMGLYLLGADYLRRREPRKRGGGGSGLVITRVSNR